MLFGGCFFQQEESCRNLPTMETPISSIRTSVLRVAPSGRTVFPGFCRLRCEFPCGQSPWFDVFCSVSDLSLARLALPLASICVSAIKALDCLQLTFSFPVSLFLRNSLFWVDFL